jgi:hypothetical protein
VEAGTRKRPGFFLRGRVVGGGLSAADYRRRIIGGELSAVNYRVQ